MTVRSANTRSRCGFAAHRLVKGLHAGALLGREAKGLCVLQDVDGSRIAVEFRHEGEAHAAAGAQVGDLLVGQSLDRTTLQARVGRGLGAMLMLCENWSGQQEPDKSGDRHVRHGVNSRLGAR